jgi:hypothetical protein
LLTTPTSGRHSQKSCPSNSTSALEIRMHPSFLQTPSVLALPQRLGRRGGRRRWAAATSPSSPQPRCRAPRRPLRSPSPERTRGVARHDPSRTPPIAVASPVTRPGPTPPVVRVSRPDPSRLRPSPSRPPPRGPARRGPSSSSFSAHRRRVPRGGEADAWGRPRAQAVGRARGTRVPPHRGGTCARTLSTGQDAL